MSRSRSAAVGPPSQAQPRESEAFADLEESERIPDQELLHIVDQIIERRSDLLERLAE